MVALGAVVRGATPHFDHVAGQAAAGLAAVTRATGVPVAFGVLTCDTMEQALDRAGGKAGNKGAEAADHRAGDGRPAGSDRQEQD